MTPTVHIWKAEGPALPLAALGAWLALAWCAGVACGAVTPRIRIEVPIFEGGEGMDFFLGCARAYEKVRPNVTVDLYGDPRIADKIRVRVLEGTFPEVTNAGLNYWALVRNGDIEPLDKYLDGPNWEGDSTWRETFLPGSLDRYSHEGKVYGLPFAYFAYAVWYNKKTFREHGWHKPRTWDEFLVLCERIKRAGIAPLAFQGRYPGYAQMVIDAIYYRMVGAKRYYEQKELLPRSFHNPDFVRALGLVQRIAMDYFQKGAMGMTHTSSQQEFFSGRAAMIFCGAWLKSEMLGKIPEGFALGAFNFPHVRGGQGDPTAVGFGSGYYFVMSHSRHKEVGVDYLRFMTSRDMAGEFSRQRDIPTSVKGTAEGNLSEDLMEMAAILEEARTSFGRAPGEGFPEMDQHWSDYRSKLLEGDITPEECARQLEAAAAAVRNRAANPNRVTVRHVWKPLALLAVLGAAIVYWLLTQVRKYRESRRQAGGVAGRLRLGWASVIVFVGPALALYTAFVIVPCGRSFVWCTQRWDGLTDMHWVGLLHFKRLLLESDAFWIALRNNLFIMFVIPLFVLPLSMFFAACISRGVRGQSIFRVVFFFPNILGGVVATLLWLHLYNPQGGPVNAALVGLGKVLCHLGLAEVGAYLKGFEGFAWLSDKHLYWALVPMSVWGACGFYMILFMAAMESIPQTMYEAAEIDGASAWTQFWQITVPMIWEVLAVAIVFMVIAGMKAFQVIWLLTNQRPVTSTHVVSTRMVQAMFTEFKVGEATAIAVLLFLMVFFGTAVTLRLMKRESVEY